MTDQISDPKVFEYIVFQHDPKKDLMLKSLDLVKDFIIERKLIITGGMAIDFALKLKGTKLYDDNTLPDYDFFSSEHSNHAYELGKILCEQLPKLFPDEDIYIDVIPALHVTTMRVRVNYTSVADITYLPPKVFDTIPVLEYGSDNKKLRFRHPHIQMIDQHRALSLPYEHAPREVILHRWKKDMKRFDMLYKYYPIEGKDQSGEIDKYQEIYLEPELLKDCCIGGFAALYLLLKREQKISTIKLPIFDGKLEPLVINSDQQEKIVGRFIDYFKSYKIKYYNQYLDILPSKYVLIVDVPEQKKLHNINSLKKDDKKLFETLGGSNDINEKSNKLEIHIYDTSNQLVAAEPHMNFHIADAQNLLAYFLSMHFITDKTIDQSSYYKDAYRTIAELVENKIRPPTFLVYGKTNIGIEHILQRAETLSWNKEIPRIKVILKPGRYHPDESKNCTIPPNLGDFVYEESPLYVIDGLETTQKPKKLIDFINPVIYESSSDEEH